MNMKIILGAVIAGFLKTIKITLAYNRALKMSGQHQEYIYLNPEIKYIALHSPLTLNDAYQVWILAQAYLIDIDCIIEYAFLARGDVEEIVRKMKKRFEGFVEYE